ncbi:MAG: hypothetical protein FWE32_09940 [Oscillospiraceae bacterium]|nr:hypothetical protein [Oscillospiraceae bacterium]
MSEQLILEQLKLMNKRFDKMDERFDQMEKDMLEQFQILANGMADIDSRMTKGFSEVNKRFGAIEKRIDEVETNLCAQLGSLARRVEGLEEKFDTLDTWCKVTKEDVRALQEQLRVIEGYIQRIELSLEHGVRDKINALFDAKLQIDDLRKRVERLEKLAV